jgi:hypothetical protein
MSVSRLALLLACAAVAVAASAGTAYAATFVSPSPAPGTSTTAERPAVSVMAFDPLGLQSAVTMRVDGLTVRPSVAYVVTGGHWVDDGCGAVWVVDYDYSRLTISYTPVAPLAPGTHTMLVHVLNLAATATDFGWTFISGTPPALSRPIPADGSWETTDRPSIAASIVGGTGSAVTMSLDGTTVPAVLDATNELVSYALPVALMNDATHTVSVSATNPCGIATLAWSFRVQILRSSDVPACVTCHPTYPGAHRMTDCNGCHGQNSPIGDGWSTPQYVVHGAADHIGRMACGYCHGSIYSSVPPLHSFSKDTYHVIGAVSCATGGSCHRGAGTVAAIHRSKGCGCCHGVRKTPTFDCSKCHDLASPHGDLNAIHASTVTSGPVYAFSQWTGQHGRDARTVPCANCHPSMNLLNLHGSGPDNCAICHFGGPRDGLGAWNRTCQQSPCHSPDLHLSAVADSSHTALLAGLPPVGGGYWTNPGWTTGGACWKCHPWGSFHDATACRSGCHSVPGWSDTTPPETTLGRGWLGGWSNEPALTVMLDAVDPGGTGVRATFYEVDAGPWLAGTPPSTRVDIAAEGWHILSYFSVDRAENRETTKSLGLGLDRTPPTTMNDAAASYVESATVHLLPRDSGVGLNYMYAQFDNGQLLYFALSGGPANPSIPFQTSSPGVHALYYWAVDMLGNREAVKSLTFTVLPPPDLTPPTTTSDITTGKAFGPNFMPVALSAADNPGGSSVAATYYRFDAHGAWMFDQPWAIYPSSYLRAGSDGTHTLDFYSIDNAGNTETVKTSPPFIIDWTPPVTSTDVLASYSGTATVHASTSDGAGSGVVSTTYWLDGTWIGNSTGMMTVTVPPPAVGAATHTLEFQSYDRAGNWETRHGVTFTVSAP